MFNDGRVNYVQDQELSGRPPVVSDHLVQSVHQKSCERRRLTISELSREFPRIPPTVLYDNITD
jgi:hypothetical protein